MESQFKLRKHRTRLDLILVWATASLILCPGCERNRAVNIAFVPRTTAMGLWEPAHRGADTAAAKVGAHIYWNAPTREDDVEGQISLIDQAVAKHYRGLVIAPDQTLALITPVRRALAHGIPTVIVSSPLPIPAEEKLFYVLNDDESGGRMAAQRVGELLHGQGSVAILGINPDIAGIMARARSFEVFLVQNYPNIHITKRKGSFNVLHEQQMAEEVVKSDPNVDAMVGLMWASTRGALSAIRANPRGRAVKVIGFDPDGAPLPFDIENLDSVIVQDTQAMGEQAVDLIIGSVKGHSASHLIKIQPTVVTRTNLDSPEIRALIWMDWKAAPAELATGSP